MPNRRNERPFEPMPAIGVLLANSGSRNRHLRPEPPGVLERRTVPALKGRSIDHADSDHHSVVGVWRRRRLLRPYPLGSWRRRRCRPGDDIVDCAHHLPPGWIALKVGGRRIIWTISRTTSVTSSGEKSPAILVPRVTRWSPRGWRKTGEVSPGSGGEESQRDEGDDVPGADVPTNEDRALSWRRRTPRGDWMKANSQRSSHRDLETTARSVRALKECHRRMSQARHRPSSLQGKR